jgi:hypothetical protein
MSQGLRVSWMAIVTCVNISVTIDGFWIEHRSYWNLRYRAWLNFTIHYYTHTHTHTSMHNQVFTSRCSVAALNGGGSAFCGFQKCPRPQLPAYHSNSSQWPNLSSSLIDSLTDWLTQLLTNQLNQLSLFQLTDWTYSSLTFLFITSPHGPHRKHISSVAVCRPLYSNGSRLVVRFVVVA